MGFRFNQGILNHSQGSTPKFKSLTLSWDWKEILLDIDTENTKDISNRILSLVKPAEGAFDDMTVIAAGIWKR